MTRKARAITISIAAVALLLVLLTLLPGLWFRGGIYPYEYLTPDSGPHALRIDLDASRRLIEGQIRLGHVQSARFTNRWPDGFTGWGRGLEPAGFPSTELTRSEIERLVYAEAAI